MRPRGAGGILAVFVVLLLTGPTLSPSAAQTDGTGKNGPPIPYPGAGTDRLSHVQRTWNATAAAEGEGVDMEGRPRDPSDGEVAFRLRTDIAALEGVLTAPDGPGTIEALANIGIRWHAVTFDPPLRFPDNRALERVTPGALNWSMVVDTPPQPHDDTHHRAVWTSVPIPTNGTVAPDAETSRAGHSPENDTTIWLVWAVSVTNVTHDRPAGETRSPAIARFTAGVWVNASRAVSPGQVHETDATFTFHHDFGAVARGVSASTSNEVNATGLYLQRTPVYTTARIAHDAHGWGNNASTVGRTVPVVTTFNVPSYGRLPKSEPSSLFSPITLNATAPLAATPAETTPWRFAGGPPVGPEGTGLLVSGELGFLADQALHANTEGGPRPAEPPPDPGKTAAALHVAWFGLAVLALALVARRHRG